MAGFRIKYDIVKIDLTFNKSPTVYSGDDIISEEEAKIAEDSIYDIFELSGYENDDVYVKVHCHKKYVSISFDSYCTFIEGDLLSAVKKMINEANICKGLVLEATEYNMVCIELDILSIEERED